MSAQALHDGLQDSLEALARGDSLERVLARNRDLAAHLRPALEAAVLLREADSEGTPTSSMVRSRARVRAALPSHHPTPFLPRSRIMRILPRFAGALAAGLIAVAAGLTGLAVASAQALPDSPFFPVKLAAEALRLELTVGSRARIALQEIHSNHRADEVRQLLAQARMARVAFEGGVQSQDAMVWYVADIRVEIPPGTHSTPRIGPGMTVLVEGQTTTDGRFLAEAIYLVGFHFNAAVSEKTAGLGWWKIGDHWILVSQDTLVDPGIRPGDIVSVSVRVENEDRLIGREILRLHVVSNTAPAAPTATARPGRTQVPDGDEDQGNRHGQVSDKKETQNQNKKSHGGRPDNRP